MMKKILIIDHYSQLPGEPGNNRFIYLAELLCQSGYCVEIVTTRFSHKQKKVREIDQSIFEGLPYQFTLLDEPGYPRNVCLSRFYSHFKFGEELEKYLNTIDRPDMIYAAVPSLDVGRVAGKFCEKHQIPFFLDIQDLWPEAFKLVFHVPVLSDIIFAPMKWTADSFYQKASKIIAVSDTYKDRGLVRGGIDHQGLCVYLGTDLARFDEYAKTSNPEKPNGEIWVAYVGTLGHSYNIEIIIDALGKLEQSITSHVVFKVFGDGPLMDRFQEYAQKAPVRVDFLGRMDYPEMVSKLCQADIAVNPIAKGAAQSIINKHADYAAAGLPVVSTQESPEYQDLLQKYECGINCSPDDALQVAQALERLICDADLRTRMGNNSRKMAEECFDRRRTYVKIVDEIKKVVGDT